MFAIGKIIAEITAYRLIEGDRHFLEFFLFKYNTFVSFGYIYLRLCKSFSFTVQLDMLQGPGLRYVKDG